MAGTARLSSSVNMIVLAAADNVGIVVRDIAEGETARAIHGQTMTAAERIPLGHKIALMPIAVGEPILRLGVPVGVATAAIPVGRLVHVHNVASRYLTNDEDHYE